MKRQIAAIALALAATTLTKKKNRCAKYGKMVQVTLLKMLAVVLFANAGILPYVAKAELELPDHIWEPYPIKMELKGVPTPSDGLAVKDGVTDFLVAGSNATATIWLTEFKPHNEWQRYKEESLSDDEHWICSGKFRHKLKSITITGYAAGRIRDSAAQVPYLSVWAYALIGLVDPGRDDLVKDALFPGFISPAKQTMRFKYDLSNLSQDSDGSDIYEITDDDFTGYPHSVIAQLPKNRAVLRSNGNGATIELPMLLPSGTGFHGAYYWTASIVYEEEFTALEKRYSRYDDETWYCSIYWYSETGWQRAEELDEGVFEYPDEEDRVFGPREGYGLADEDDSNANYDAVDQMLMERKNGGLALLLITNETGRVFFDKYGADYNDNERHPIPNWFTYWKEDGACPSLKNLDLRGLIILDHDTKGYGAWVSDREFDAKLAAREYVKEKNSWAKPDNIFTSFIKDGKVHLPYSFSERYYDNREQKWKWSLNPAGAHYPNGLSLVNNKEFGGIHIYGIYTLEEVLAHEMQHRYTHYSYEKLIGLEKWYDKLLGIETYGTDSDKDLDEDKMIPYVDVNGVTRYRCRCDFLVDISERSLGLDVHNTDTYNIGTIKNDNQYKAYGDDEFLAMMAANKVTDEWRAVWTNDWAFPGEQSYVPSDVKKGRESNSIRWYEKREAKLPVSKAQVQASVKRMQTKLTTSEKECAIPSIIVNGISKNVVNDENTGFVSAACFKIDMKVDGLHELRLTGVMTDCNSNVVAYANAAVLSGNVFAELRFQGADIYESRREGPFRLDRVKLVAFDGNDFSELATLSEFKDGDVDLHHGDFARNDAYLLNVANETVSTNGIEVSVNIEVNTAGEYGLAATLVNTNGVPVASGNASVACAHGTNCVRIVFAASDILQSGVDGPYVIDNIALYKDGARVDSRLDFYTTRKVYRRIAFYFDEEEEFDPAEFMGQFEDYIPPAEATPPEWFWVFFNPNGGSISEMAREVKDGDLVGTLPIPTLENDEFLGWFTELEGGTRISDSTVVTTNVMYHARWKIGVPVDPITTQQVWTVMFDARGGSLGTASPTKAVEKGKAVGDLPKATRTGYTFNGWYTKTSGGTKVKTSTKVTQDVTYYAQWTANKYTIKFDKNGGTGSMKSLSATYGKNVTLTANAFKKSNNTFLGWAMEKGATEVEYKDKAKVKNLTDQSGGTATLYAVWKPYMYTVKFSANGGEGGTVKQTVGCGTKTALTANGFTRAGFRFAGWATKKGGSVVYKNKAKVKDLAKKGKSVTLYAVWYPEKWAVGTFTGEGTIGNTSVKKRKAATVTLTVGSTGKISGKFVLANKKSYSFKADAFTEFTNGALCVETTIKYGSKKCALRIAISQDDESDATVADLMVTYKGKGYGAASLE